MAAARSIPWFVEIGSNLTDTMYKGMYHGKTKHVADVDRVLSRARNAGVAAQMITVSSLSELDEAFELSNAHDDLFCTAGCHPTRSGEMDTYPGGPCAYVDKLAESIQRYNQASREKPRILAIGECGLDYDRLHFAPADGQRRSFETQLGLAKRLHMPLFLHSRAAHSDLIGILRRHWDELVQAVPQQDADQANGKVGVVHSFTGTGDELRELLELGLYVGVNGCSLKTQENLDVVRQIPPERIMLETDAPWCDIRLTHASAPLLDAFRKKEPELAKLYSPPKAKPEKWSADALVKGRNEPCTIGEVAAVVSELQGIDIRELARHALANASRLFGLRQDQAPPPP